MLIKNELWIEKEISSLKIKEEGITQLSTFSYDGRDVIYGTSSEIKLNSDFYKVYLVDSGDDRFSPIFTKYEELNNWVNEHVCR